MFDQFIVIFYFTTSNPFPKHCSEVMRHPVHVRVFLDQNRVDQCLKNELHRIILHIICFSHYSDLSLCRWLGVSSHIMPRVFGLIVKCTKTRSA